MSESQLLQNDALLRVAMFALMLTVMGIWETVSPRRALGESRARRWRTNLGVAALNTVLLRVLLPGTAIGVAEFAAHEGWGLLNHFEIGGWIALVAAILALDFAIYLQHALFHAVPALARIHQVHHADPDFDTTTGIRFHPLEIVLSMLIKYAAIVTLGAPALAVLVFELLLNLTSLFNHGNVLLPERFDAWLRRFLVTPDMHRIHHSVIPAERNSNYGFCLSIWDRLFGSYTPAPAGGQTGMRIGMPDFQDANVSTTLSGVLSIPFKGAAAS